MGKDKKSIRAAFRDQCITRSKGKCEVCGKKPGSEGLEVHHITNRKEMPAGGYVAANGIAICSSCHIKAEDTYFHRKMWPGYTRDELYMRIASSYAQAYRAAESIELLQQIFGVKD